MRTATFGLTLWLAVAGATAARGDDAPEPTTIDLWPGAAPGEQGAIEPEKVERTDRGVPRSITNVTRPTLTVYRPEAGKANGVAVVVAPGGGYNMLAWDHEGDQVARWLNSLGVTAAVLKYRVPRRPGHPKDQPPPQALMDAQRALSLVRSKAEQWGIDPKRIGMLGFSAGGHLTAWAATNPDRRAYEPIDAADEASPRPDFAVLVYPGGIVRRGSDAMAPEIRISADAPPTFFAHAADDRVSAENSIQMFLALRRAGVPAELHVYSTGGHGFGLRPSDKPASTWPRRCEEWLRIQGILPPAGTP